MACHHAGVLPGTGTLPGVEAASTPLCEMQVFVFSLMACKPGAVVRNEPGPHPLSLCFRDVQGLGGLNAESI